MNEISNKILKLYEDYLYSDALLEYYCIERDRQYINTKTIRAKNEGHKPGEEKDIVETKKDDSKI